MGIRWQLLLHWRCGAEAVGCDLDQQQNWLLSVPSSPIMLGLGRQICHHAEVDSKKSVPTKDMTVTLGYQMAKFCYTGVAVPKRLAVTSVSSRTGCCLYRLLRQCSDWGGKSVIMQRSTQKTFVPTKDVTVTLGIRWELFVTLASLCRSGLP